MAVLNTAVPCLGPELEHERRRRATLAAARSRSPAARSLAGLEHLLGTPVAVAQPDMRHRERAVARPACSDSPPPRSSPHQPVVVQQPLGGRAVEHDLPASSTITRSQTRSIAPRVVGDEHDRRTCAICSRCGAGTCAGTPRRRPRAPRRSAARRPRNGPRSRSQAAHHPRRVRLDRRVDEMAELEKATICSILASSSALVMP